MLSLFYVVFLLRSAGLIEGASLGRFTARASHGSNIFPRQGEESCLKTDLIQSASALTGQEPGTEGIKPGQAASRT